MGLLRLELKNLPVSTLFKIKEASRIKAMEILLIKRNENIRLTKKRM